VGVMWSRESNFDMLWRKGVGVGGVDVRGIKYGVPSGFLHL
jgi:hypothetical protein